MANLNIVSRMLAMPAGQNAKRLFPQPQSERAVEMENKEQRPPTERPHAPRLAGPVINTSDLHRRAPPYGFNLK
jgi:hypothetical protein